MSGIVNLYNPGCNLVSANGGSSNSTTTTWSKDSWFDNIVTTVSSGTKGGNYSTTTATNKSSGKDQEKWGKMGTFRIPLGRGRVDRNRKKKGVGTRSY